MIGISKARFIASKWHGGPTTAMYRFYRTGVAGSPMTLLSEVRQAQQYARNPRDRRDLEMLHDYLTLG